MKIFTAIAVLAVGTGLWAGDRGQKPKLVLTACMNPGANTTMIYRGQATATQILRQAGVQLNWRSDERTCLEGGGILVTVAQGTPTNQHPGALAFALPYDPARKIVLFYDRVLNTASPALTPALLGYVLAHEIVPMLQGVDLHTDSGVMKARWDTRDYCEMQCGRLKLSQEDIAWIDHAQEWRVANAARPE